MRALRFSVIGLGAAVFLAGVYALVFISKVPEPCRISCYVTADLHCDFGSRYARSPLPALYDVLRRAGALTRDTSILIDTGDTCQGSALNVMFRGASPAADWALFPYDVMVPGNHEFDFGVDSFYQYARMLPRTAVLCCANIRLDSSCVVSHALIERNALRIGVIGMTSRTLLRRFDLQPDSRFEFLPDDSAALEAALAALRPKRPDMVILAVHAGLYGGSDLVRRLSARYPEIDLVLGGHSHTCVENQPLFGGIPFFQPPRQSRTLWRIDCTFFRPGERPVLTYARMDLPETYTVPDSVWATLVGAHAERAPRWAVCPDFNPENEVKSPYTFERHRAWIHQAVCAASGCRVSHVNAPEYFLLKDSVMTDYHLHRLFPYPDALVKVRAPYACLEAVLCEIYAKERVYRLREFSGLDLKPLHTRKKRRFKAVTPSGVALAPDSPVEWVTTSYLMSGMNGRIKAYANLRTDSRVTIEVLPLSPAEALKRYGVPLRKHATHSRLPQGPCTGDSSNANACQ